MRMGAPGRAGSPDLLAGPGQESWPPPRFRTVSRRQSAGTPRSDTGFGCPRRRSLRSSASPPTAARSPFLGGSRRHFRRVAKQLRGESNTQRAGGCSAPRRNRYPKPQSAMGTSSETLVRLGRRRGQAKEGPGELNRPMPAGVGIASDPQARGERRGCQARAPSPSEVDAAKSKAALGSM